MAEKERPKLDVIRLKREDESNAPARIRKSPPVRKLVIRLLSGLSEHLRSEMRYRGDLSSMVIEALSSVDLEIVPLVDMGIESRLKTTTVALPPQLHARIKTLAKARSSSMNEMVNTAIAHWLAGKKLIRLL